MLHQSRYFSGVFRPRHLLKNTDNMSDIATNHPQQASDHEANRLKVCGPCGRKLKVRNIRLLQDSHVGSIKRHMNADYSLANPVFPLGICNSCWVNLSKASCSDDIKLPEMPNYEDIVLSKETRGSSTCNCFICLVARDKTRQPEIKPRKSGVFNDISVHHGLYGASSSNKLPSTRTDIDKKSFVKICPDCKQEVGRGISHSCTVASSSQNVVDLALDLPTKQQEQVISSLIATKAKEKEGHTRNVSLTLSTKGATTSVLVNPTEKGNVFFSNENLDNLQTSLGLSNIKVKKVCNWIRTHTGRKSISAYYRKHVSERGKLLKDIYNVQIQTFKDNKGNDLQRHVVWADAAELVEAVCNERSFAGPVVVKAMADGGQGFLKICLTILPHNYDPDLDRAPTDKELEILEPDFAVAEEAENLDSPKKKRSRYTEGGTLQKGKLTGVQRLIMLCIVPDIPETHFNMKVLFQLTNLNSVKYILVSDFKLLLIVLGLQTATAMFPCPYCFIRLDEMRNVSSMEQSLSEESVDAPRDRTFGKLKESHQKFTDVYNGNKRKAKLADSTVNPSLIEEDDDLRVLDKCPPGELHLLQGFTNHLFFHGLVPLLGRDKAMKWPLALNVVSQSYHGEVFEGNAARKLIKNSDLLQSPEVMNDIDPLAVQPYISAFKAMDALVSSCFGTHKVKGNVSELVEKLTRTYLGLHISITLKMHVIFEHLVPCLLNLGGEGLGLYSEQAGESIHRQFLKHHWEKYKINLLDHPNYGEALFNSVVEFSSRHL